MEASVTTFSARLQQPWLTCELTQTRIAETFHQLANTLQTLPKPAFFVIAPTQPETTLAAVLAALATQCPAVLSNPQWTPAETDNAVQTLGGNQLWLTDATASTNTATALTDTASTNAVQTGIATSTAPPQADTTGTNTETANANAAPPQTNPAPPQTNASRAKPPASPASQPQPPSPLPDALLPDALHLQYRQHGDPSPLASAGLAGYLLVPTGGTGGRLKLAYHNWQTLHNAIDGYARFWRSTRLNCVCALPVCHIGGLMPALRTFVSGGRLCLLPWQQLLARLGDTNDLPDLHTFAKDWQVSLVPTQVQRLLGDAAAVRWLRSMQAVLIGGGSSGPELLKSAAALRISLCPAYGMTEAAATVALQRPEDFFRDYQSASPPAVPSAEVLPHFTVFIEANNATAPSAPTAAANDDAIAADPVASLPRTATPATHGEVTGAQEVSPAAKPPTPASGRPPASLPSPVSGRIILSGSSLFHGYFPHIPHSPDVYPTGDAGHLRDANERPQYLCVLGRIDRIIISGGKKIDPSLVEQCIAAEAQKLNIKLSGTLVTSVPDPRWGQRLIAFVALTGAAATDAAPLPVPEALPAAVHKALPAHQRPKQWFALHQLPLNERGKPDRPRIQALAEAAPEA